MSVTMILAPSAPHGTAGFAHAGKLAVQRAAVWQSAWRIAASLHAALLDIMAVAIALASTAASARLLLAAFGL